LTLLILPGLLVLVSEAGALRLWPSGAHVHLFFSLQSEVPPDLNAWLAAISTAAFAIGLAALKLRGIFGGQ
jgi:hypothetical protein